MKRTRMIGVCLMAACAMSAVAAASASAGKYVVVLKDSVGDPGAVAQQQAKEAGAKVSHVYSHALKGYAASFSAATASAIAANPGVAYVAPDESFQAAAAEAPTCASSSPRSSQQCLPAWADRIDAESSSTKSGDGRGSVNVNVAVVDSGIDATHPDLNVAGGVNCSNGQSFEDAFGHGTMVAGIIGAKDNNLGVVGVAPGAKLWSARVLNDWAGGSSSSLLCGVDWVTATRTDTDPTNDIAVANMSIVHPGNNVGDDGNCGYTRKDPVHQAICASVTAGVTYVVAAGNETVDFRNTVPGAYHEALTATAIDDTDGQPGGLTPPPTSDCTTHTGDDVYASFSNFAALAADQAHTIAAPGVCDLSTYPLAKCATKKIPHPSACFNVESGTSFASPAVAGTVALCIAGSACTGLTPAQIIKKIMGDAQAYNTLNPGYGFVGDPFRPVEGKYYGYLIHAGSY